MQKIVLNNGKELVIESIISQKYMETDKFEITFAPEVTFAEIIDLYDKDSKNYSYDAIRKFNLFESPIEGEWTLQGTHYGFTILTSVTYANGKTSLLVEQENELKNKIAMMTEDMEYLGMQVSDLELQILESQLNGGVK